MNVNWGSGFECSFVCSLLLAQPTPVMTLNYLHRLHFHFIIIFSSLSLSLSLSPSLSPPFSLRHLCGQFRFAGMHSITMYFVFITSHIATWNWLDDRLMSHISVSNVWKMKIKNSIALKYCLNDATKTKTNLYKPLLGNIYTLHFEANKKKQESSYCSTAITSADVFNLINHLIV